MRGVPKTVIGKLKRSEWKVVKKIAVILYKPNPSHRLLINVGIMGIGMLINCHKWHQCFSP